MKKILIMACALVSLGFVTSCGVKPSDTDSRQTYPDVRTDPAPRGGSGHNVPINP